MSRNITGTMACAAALLLAVGVSSRAEGAPADSDGLFTVRAFNVVGGGGSNDNDLNSTLESLSIWNALDVGGGPTGTLPASASRSITTTYNFQNVHRNTTASVIDYAGGGGQFGTDNAYSTIGGGLGGDDFSVRARGFVKFNTAGTYSIAAGSDDGRVLTLADVGMSPGYAGFSATGGQLSTPPTAADTVGYNGTTGHNTSTGVLSVNAGDVLGLSSFFFERGGGDSFEVSIKSGSDTSAGGPGDGWSLLTDGALAGAVNVSTNTAFSDTSFHVDAFNIVGGGGSNDNDLNSVAETQALWGHLDANPGFTGGAAAISQTQTTSGIYNVENNHINTDDVVNYAGGSGDFDSGNGFPDNPYSDIGTPGLGGDDFSVRAQTYMTFTEAGTYSIAVASDDGRQLELTAARLMPGSPFAGFTAEGEQRTVENDPFLLLYEDPSGHDQTTGVFDVAAGDILFLDAFFFERGGGDSFEISIKKGSDTGFGGTGDGWVPLRDGVLGIQLATAIPEPLTLTLAGLAVAGLGGYVRRRRRA